MRVTGWEFLSRNSGVRLNALASSGCGRRTNRRLRRRRLEEAEAAFVAPHNFTRYLVATDLRRWIFFASD